MSSGFWLVVVFILFVVAWVISKVLFYVRKSEQQWQDADKSKIRKFEDDEW